MLSDQTVFIVSGNPRIRVVPLPQWVVHEPFEPIEAEPDSHSGGLHTLYHDSQVDLRGERQAWNWRYAHKVMTLDGAERAAQFSVVFDPACEELEIHYIRVRRRDATANHARPEIFEVLRRERSMERLVLDGRLTVAAVIPDVRIGDIIEACCTIYGTNACLKGRYATWITFSSSDPIIERRHRLLRSSKRVIATRTFNGAPDPQVIDDGAVADSRWRSIQRGKVVYEDRSPPWHFRSAAVQFSDYSSWSDVAALFTGLYDPPPELPHDLASLIDQLAHETASPTDRAARALFFVQRHLRYLALSFGEGGYVPRPINIIWETGYGDCKDASRLFVSVARRLGLDACPALVSTSYGPGLNSWLPSAHAFDHCIVRVRIDGKTYWLDPTLRAQAGQLDRLYRPHFGWALPLLARREESEDAGPWTVPPTVGMTGLEHMGPSTPQLVLDVREHIIFGPQSDSPARYECHADHYSWRADGLRNRVANDGVSTIGQEYAQYVRTKWLDVTEKAPLEIIDDTDLNRVSATERYEILSPWKRTEKGVSFQSNEWYLTRELPALPPGRREDEIYLGTPRILRRQLTLDMPVDWRCQVWDETYQLDGLKYVSKLTIESPRRLVLNQELTIESQIAPAAAIDRYSQITAALRERGDVDLWHTGSWGHSGGVAVSKESNAAQVVGGAVPALNIESRLTILQKIVGAVILGFWGLIVLGYVLRTLQAALQ